MTYSIDPQYNFNGNEQEKQALKKRKPETSCKVEKVSHACILITQNYRSRTMQ